jgi:hypothetical protein
MNSNVIELEIPEIQFEKETEQKPGPGRPKVVIDQEQVIKLAKLGANNVEIADFFDCSESVIRKRFAAVLRQSRSHLKMRLRQAMIDNAIHKGNVVAQIWLSKNYLRMTDNGPADELADENKILPWSEE